MGDGLLKIEEIAKILRVSENIVKWAIWHGDLFAICLQNGDIVVPRFCFDNFISNCCRVRGIKKDTLVDIQERKINISLLNFDTKLIFPGYSYCPKFNNKFKERVRAFFGYTCQKCGHIWQPGERRLAVHHVNYRKDSCCNENVRSLFIPICSDGCHSETNANREYWEKHFTEIIDKEFAGKCYFTKEEWEMLQ